MTLNVLGWEGYDDPDIIRGFKQATGCGVVVEEHISDYDATQSVLRTPGRWDVVNINSPYVRDVLHLSGRIKALDRRTFDPAAASKLSQSIVSDFQQWGLAPDGTPIGMCQRFGPFNIVINTSAISLSMAENAGFLLPEDPGLHGRYGILAYDDFNVMHIAIASGLNPFEPMPRRSIDIFAATARHWFSHARIVTTDHNKLNQALLDGTIDFYLSGGVYTASSARRDGHSQVRAVTPLSGPIQGCGGVSFVEVNAVLADAPAADAAVAFLDYLERPDVAVSAALAGQSANPVLQMCNASVFARFDQWTLDAMQWDTLEADLDRCAQYRIAPDYKLLHAVLVSARHTARAGLLR